MLPHPSALPDLGDLLLPHPGHPAVVWLAASLLFLVLTYAGYPLAIRLKARLARPRPLAAWPGTLPTVTCVVAAHDEGEQLVRKVENLLALDYPSDRLDVIIADDGSRDGAPARARALAPDRVRVATNPAQLGKPSALARAVPLARGELLLLCDSRQRFDPGAARALVRPFGDPRVGAVTGQLRLDAARGPGAYWRYETGIRVAEGRCGSVVGATGAIYAIRRELFPEQLPQDTILDDVYVPMRVVLAGREVVYAEDALAFDRELDVGREFTRKVRTLAGNYQLLFLLPALLTPATNPVFWRFFWHKVARLLCPWALLVALGAAWNAPGLLPQALFAVQLYFYGLALLGHLRLGHAGRVTALCHTFVALNVAAVWALWRFTSRQARVAWVQTSTLGDG
ncbi:glycosyltransferase family 2 protein [Anaeromyxobacter paludicola]|uniref:Glycosyl transferase n=1 Tax=Anaeromyxobacter paludicola TaxID=2918171 RepID=A0ABN6N861_9BACT|nr:glycosyltransferase family 2 protein [Anaeromyxobacter paludicola]BDG09392.1 glycosyl transferase [Anaeromyxobacter paludicola]